MAKFVQVDDPSKADASPTKAFFVEIITKDIQLDEAIQDLVDNCVDGAKRLRPGEGARYDDLWVKLDVKSDHFTVSDNCGGMPLEIARKYAFKFGRAKGFAATSHSVGQFGIGMKRALFKIGKQFNVHSTEPNARYEIDVDVSAWSRDDVDWDFDIKDLGNGPFDEFDTGTILHVPELADGVAETFAQVAFLSALRHDIRTKHQQPMSQGLQILVNDEAIIPSAFQLKVGEGIVPAFRRFTDDLGGASPLNTRLYAGVHESSRPDAGWYIFCNGRCILVADQENTTGWNQVSEDGVGVPKYHGQFARFRGFAFLDSDDASILPWNTTKTGLDPESAAYRRLLSRLIEVTRPVIDFLNLLDAEKDYEEADKALSRAVKDARSVPLERLSASPTFLYTPPPKRGPPMARINYQKTRAEVERLMQALDVSSYRAAGIQSFEFTYDQLVEDD